MKKITIILTLLISVGAAAQSVKSMNSIKRNPLYIYSEATMETASEAYEVASELLYVQAKEYAAGKKSFANKDILLRNIKSQRDSIQMKRGEMYKVFLYIKKSDVIDVENVTLVSSSPVSEESSAVNGGSAIQTVVLPEGQAGTAPAADSSLKLSTHWQQALVDELLAEPNFASARAKIVRYKAEYKVKSTGPIATCRNLPAAFLLVGKDGKVVTVLGPGETERTDFRSLTKTTMEKYSSMDIVWFNLAK